jgi:hypothetical protein
MREFACLWKAAAGGNGSTLWVQNERLVEFKKDFPLKINS